MSVVTQGELAVLDFIRSHLSCGFLDKVMPAVTHLGDSGMAWIILAAAAPRGTRWRLRAGRGI